MFNIFELPLIKVIFPNMRKQYNVRKTIATSKRYIFRKRAQKLNNIFTFYGYISQFFS